MLYNILYSSLWILMERGPPVFSVLPPPQVPVSKFHELRYNVALILKEMNNLEKRSILQIQDWEAKGRGCRETAPVSPDDRRKFPHPASCLRVKGLWTGGQHADAVMCPGLLPECLHRRRWRQSSASHLVYIYIYIYIMSIHKCISQQTS